MRARPHLRRSDCVDAASSYVSPAACTVNWKRVPPFAVPDSCNDNMHHASLNISPAACTVNWKRVPPFAVPDSCNASATHAIVHTRSAPADDVSTLGYGYLYPAPDQ